ncbi:hypothetical protein CO172_02455, partial [Candidatus Uhrbacteria bacterium CG_4_9_14_3_um_filter_36_7]
DRSFDAKQEREVWQKEIEESLGIYESLEEPVEILRLLQWFDLLIQEQPPIIRSGSTSSCNTSTPIPISTQTPQPQNNQDKIKELKKQIQDESFLLILSLPDSQAKREEVFKMIEEHGEIQKDHLKKVWIELDLPFPSSSHKTDSSLDQKTLEVACGLVNDPKTQETGIGILTTLYLSGRTSPLPKDCQPPYISQKLAYAMCTGADLCEYAKNQILIHIKKRFSQVVQAHEQMKERIFQDLRKPLEAIRVNAPSNVYPNNLKDGNAILDPVIKQMRTQTPSLFEEFVFEQALTCHYPPCFDSGCTCNDFLYIQEIERLTKIQNTQGIIFWVQGFEKFKEQQQ